jgi:hypothetical protein
MRFLFCYAGAGARFSDTEKFTEGLLRLNTPTAGHV